MMNKVYIKVKTNLSSFVKYLINHNIEYDGLRRNNNSYYLYTSYENYKKISRRYECIILKYYGKNGFLFFLSKYKYFLISFIWGIFLITLLQNTIFKIEIKTSDEFLYNILNESLKKYGIEKYRKKKNFNDIQLIKEKILSENNDILEWLEIKENGCNYEIMITKRVKGSNEFNDKDISHIVAKKDGLIKHIVASRGQKLKSINDYVKKGDIIISGLIIKNEDDIKNKVHALGEVYGEVWYTVNISVPYNYTEYVNTNKIINHYYLDIFGKKFTLMGKYDSNNIMSKKSIILDKPYLFFKLYKEEKTVYEYKKFQLSKKDAYQEALKRASHKIENKLKDGEYIISKKVLKKDEFSSKIELEVFFKVYENITDELIVNEEEINNERNLN